jgi:hypothetical protein
MDDWLNLAQWPAMVATVVSSWLVGSSQPDKRSAGFWVFLSSNALWVAWGWHTGAWALVTLQVILLAMNVRGLNKASDEQKQEPA